MHFARFRFLLVFAALLGFSRADTFAQAFQIAPSQINIVVAPGFQHADLRVPITGTATGFDFTSLTVGSDASWVTPSIASATGEVLLVFHTSGLLNSSNTATITVTGGGTTDTFTIRAAVAPLNIVKLADDPVRSRTYGVQQDGVNAGALVAIDPLTNTNIACLTVGKRPADLAISADGSEALVINAADQSITAVDLATFQVRETIPLPTYVNWDVTVTSADVAYGRGNILYYTDGSWAPVLYVFDRVKRQILQQVIDDTYGFGDFAITPDGAALYAWTQYGWTAGYAGSNLTRYSIGATGLLTFVQRTSSTYPTTLSRDPLDTPVLIDPSPTHVFAKQLAVDPHDLTNTLRSFPGPVYSISPGGEIAVTASAIFDSNTGLNLFTLPVSTTVQAITSDYTRLVYFNKTTRSLGTLHLLDAIGAKVLNRELSPADGAITLAPARLQWSALPGVDSYQLYLGQSRSVVESADAQSPTYLGEAHGPNFTLPTALLPGTTYFWRIDAVTAAGPSKGDLYTFTVSPISVDLSRVDAATVQGHASYAVDLQLSSTNAGTAFSASADVPWISFETSATATPAKLTVKLDATSLLPGVHTATISVALVGGQVAFTLPVTFEVEPLAITAMESDRTSGRVYALSEQASVNGSSTHAYLLELDSAAGVIRRAVRVGSSATDLAVHNADGRIYVANWVPGSLLAVDMATFRQVQAFSFTPYNYSYSYYDGDVYRVAAGAQGRVMVESEDQWIALSIFDTVAGKVVKDTTQVREGGGEYDPSHRYYYHGDDNISDASIHKYDLVGDVFNETVSTRVSSVNYYGSRTVVVSEDGHSVFWNGALFDQDLTVQWNIGDEIFSTSADGRLAFSATKIYDTTTHSQVLAMPASTKVSAYNSTTQRLVAQVGSAVKFYDLSTTSLPAPLLTATGVTTGSAQLSWTDNSLESGFTLQRRAVGDTDWLDVSSSIPANTTTYSVTGLASSQAYEFRIKADAATQASPWSNIVTVTTGGIILPVAVTSPATNVTPSTATLQGLATSFGFAPTVYFEYGLTTGYGSSTFPSILASGVNSAPVSTGLQSLQASQTYHFRLVVANSNGTARGSDQSFTTGPAVPSISLSSPILSSGTQVILRGIIASNGSNTNVHFEYGTTLSPLDQSTSTISFAPTAVGATVSQTIFGLSPSTTYYYRLVATNATGDNASTTSTFHTPNPGTPGLIIANPDSAYTAHGQARAIDVTANDVGAGSPLVILSVGQPSSGVAFGNGDGTVTYVPGPSFPGHDSFTYTLGDLLGRQAIGTVTVRDTYTSSVGTYDGLIGTSTSNFQDSGRITITIGRKGAITGQLTFGGIVYPFVSFLHEDGAASFRVKQSASQTLLVNLQVQPDLQTVSGSLSGSGGAADFSASRLQYSAAHPAPQAGKYTFLLPPDPAAGNQGYGFATGVVRRNGLVQIIGKTGVAKTFTSSGYVGGDSRFPLYSLLSRAQGTSLHGWVQFRTLAQTDCDGPVGWSSNSFSATLPISWIGSRYVAPASKSLVLPFTASNDNAVLAFGHGADPLADSPLPLTLMPRKLTSGSVRVKNLHLAPASGLFSGTIMINGKASSFQGVAFQRQELGAGYFTDATAPGWLRLLSKTSLENPTGGGSITTGGVIQISGGTLTLGTGSQVSGGTLTLSRDPLTVAPTISQ